MSPVKIWHKLALSLLFLLFPIFVHGFECEDLFVIASLNLEDFGNGGDDCKADLLDDLARIIVAESVDLIALQEVMPANEKCYKIDQDVDNANPKLVHIAQLLRELEELSGDRWESISSGPYVYGERKRTEYYATSSCSTHRSSTAKEEDVPTISSRAVTGLKYVLPCTRSSAVTNSTSTR